MRGIGGNRSARIQLDPEIDQQPTLNGPGESHRQQYQIRFQLELAAGQLHKVRAPVGENLSLQTNRVDSRDATVLAGERGSGNAPVALATLLVRV